MQLADPDATWRHSAPAEPNFWGREGGHEDRFCGGQGRHRAWPFRGVRQMEGVRGQAKPAPAES